MTTATDVVLACENRLGFVPRGRSLTAGRRAEAGKINQRLARENSVTLEDLLLAVEFCHRRRQSVVSPMALFWRVEEARELAHTEIVLTELSARVQTALDWELASSDPDREDWIGKLTRAHGEARRFVLADWAQAGRG